TAGTPSDGASISSASSQASRPSAGSDSYASAAAIAASASFASADSQLRHADWTCASTSSCPSPGRRSSDSLAIDRAQPTTPSGERKSRASLDIAPARRRSSSLSVTPTDSPDILARFHAELDLVDIVARQLVRTIGKASTLDDLRSFGREGLLKAARSFDASRGVPFRRW